MINFWINFIFLLFSWFLAIYRHGFSLPVLITSGLFFTLYFILPLLKTRLAQLAYYALPLIIAGSFFAPAFNGFAWLIYLALAIQATTTFQAKGLNYYLGYLLLLAVAPYLYFQQWLAVGYSLLLALVTGAMFYALKKATEGESTLSQQYDTLHDDYQLLKRQLANSEQLVRQEERNQIAREIHDSVGHRLTALLMQLEAARLQAKDDQLKMKFTELKKIAQASLQETREAVKTLKSEETSGIQAVIQLIRKLELESQLRLTITMQTGVLGVVLSNRQSVAVYRSIQEALTNMMRHSSSRQATIEFQIVGQRDLRFSISHPIKGKIKVQEGFGLVSMRERLAEIDGRLSIQQTEDNFEVIGQFPLEGDNDDKDITS